MCTTSNDNDNQGTKNSDDNIWKGRSKKSWKVRVNVFLICLTKSQYGLPDMEVRTSIKVSPPRK